MYRQVGEGDRVRQQKSGREETPWGQHRPRVHGGHLGGDKVPFLYLGEAVHVITDCAALICLLKIQALSPKYHR